MAGGTPDPNRENTLYQQIQSLLEEIAAYRKFFQTADIQSLSL
jgi:hypothetical protein